MITIPPNNLLFLICAPHAVDDVLVLVVARWQGELACVVVLDEFQLEGLLPAVPAPTHENFVVFLGVGVGEDASEGVHFEVVRLHVDVVLVYLSLLGHVQSVLVVLVVAFVCAQSTPQK